MKISTIKKGCLITFISIIVIFFALIWAINEAFGEDNYTVKIDQNIGGELICDVTYSADLQSTYYFIDYEYKDPKGKLFEFGSGLYTNVEYQENDQLLKYKNWTILPTETDFGSIKIIAIDLKSRKRSEFIIEPHSIQDDSLWKSKDINAILMYSPSEVKLDTIIQNKIFVKYTFRTDRENPENLGSRFIRYEIDEKDGIPKMRNIQR